MELKTQTQLIFIEEIDRVSQRTGNKYTQIKLADPIKYENYTFYKGDELDTTQLKQGDKVTALFEVVPQGFNNNLNLKTLLKA